MTASEVDGAATTTEAGAGPAASAPGRRPVSARERRALCALLGVVLVPIAVAVVRVATSDWVPVGDSAVIAVRSHDVFGGQAPLLGMWASTSWAVGFDMNHPGPLLFDVLAVPIALFGTAAGSAVGMGLINAVSVAGLFVVCRRRGGTVAAALAMAVAALLCWSFGSAVLVEPWHATAVLLPFLLLAALAWSVADGDLPCLPVAVVVASLILQTNLSYGVLVPALLVWASVGYVLGRRRAGPVARETGARRAVLATLVVGLVCWAQPLAEQLFGDGEGNLSRLWRGLREDQQTLDWQAALRSVARVVAVPPWWVRPSYGDGFVFGAFGNPLPALLTSLVGLAVVVALLVWCGRDARRRGDRTGLSAIGTAGVVLAAALVSANQTPTATSGTVAYQVRWLWPVGAFVVLAVVVCVARRAPDGHRARQVGLGAGAVAVVAALANLPASHQATTAPESTEPVAAGIVADLETVDLPSTVRVECWEGVFDPYCEAVLAGLADRGIDFVQPGGQALRQLGTARRWDGDPGVPVLTVVAGELAGFGPEGAERLAVHEPLTDDEAEELRALRAEAATALSSGELRLNERGTRLAGDGELPSVDGDGRSPGDIDGEQAVAVREFLFGYYRHDLDVMVGEGLLDAAGDWPDRLDRYLRLQTEADDDTVAVYLTTEPSGRFPAAD